jgi:hypothetical protein
MRFAMHLLGYPANGNHFARHPVYGYYGGFIHHHFIVMNDDSIRCSQVYGYVLLQKTE